MPTTISSGRANSPKLTANIADHGTIYGGRGLVFDGVTDGLQTSGNTPQQLADANAFSVTTWIKPTDVSTSGNVIISGYNRATFSIQRNGNGLLIYVANTILLNNSSLNKFANNKWSHLAVTYDEVNLKYYIDGELIGTVANTTSIDVHGAFKSLYIGSQNLTSAFFNGSISDVKVYSSVLSESDITSQYLKPESVPSPSTLVAWYPMCEGNPDSPQSIVYDHSEKKLGSNTFVGLNQWSPKVVDRESVSVSGDELTLTIPSANDAGMNTGNLANLGLSTSLGYAVGDLVKLQFEAKIVTNGSGFGETVRFYDVNEYVFSAINISLTSEYQTFTFYGAISNLGYSIPSFLRMGNRTGTDVYNLKNFSVQKVLMGNHATTNFFGDELITNGDFSSATGWTDASNLISSGVAHFDTSGSEVYIEQTNKTVVGKTYQLEYDITEYTSGTIKTRYAPSITLSTSVDTGHTTTFVAEGTTFGLKRGSGSGTTNIKIDNVSLKEVGVSSSGFATADSEPTIPQVPLLRYNEKMWGDGIDNQVSTSASFNLGKKATLSVWVIPNRITAAEGDTDRIGIIGSQYYTSGQFHLGIHNSDRRIFWSATNATSGYWDLSASQFDIGKLSHLCLVYDTSQTGNAGKDSSKLYVNGVYAGASVAGSQSTTDLQCTNFNMGDTNQQEFSGLIDEVSIWNHAFSETEIQELFSDGVALDANSHSKVDNLLGYWRNDGVSSWVDRSDSQAIILDGTDDYISYGSDVDISGDFTLSWWMYMSDTSQGWAPVFYKAGNYVLYHKASGTFQWRINAFSGPDFSFTATANSWQHFTFVRNGSSVDLYQNGVTVDDTETISGGNLQFNKIGHDGSSAYLQANISQVACWSSALSSSDIASIYALGRRNVDLSSSYSTNLVGYWLFSGSHSTPDATGSNGILDRSTNSNTGTITGATLIGINNGTPAGTPESIVVREGLNSNKDGLGFPFKNDDKNVLRISQGDDYVRVNKSIGNLLGDSCQAFSYECWFKVPDTNIDDGIITFADDLSSAGTGAGIRISVNRIIWTFKLDGSYENVYTGFTSTEWNHVAVVYDGSNYANTKLYLNGSAVQTAGSSSFPSSQNFANTYFYIGLYYQLANSGLKGGMIDEVRVYNKTLSATEVLKNYKHQKGKHK